MLFSGTGNVLSYETAVDLYCGNHIPCYVSHATRVEISLQFFSDRSSRLDTEVSIRFRKRDYSCNMRGNIYYFAKDFLLKREKLIGGSVFGQHIFRAFPLCSTISYVIRSDALQFLQN